METPSLYFRGPYSELEVIMEKKVRTNSGRLIRWTSLAKNVDLKTYEAVMNLGITGVYGNRKNQRFYPGNELASHVIGFVNHESFAVSGIEEMCDYYLRGQDGWVETEETVDEENSLTSDLVRF